MFRKQHLTGGFIISYPEFVGLVSWSWGHTFEPQICITVSQEQKNIIGLIYSIDLKSLPVSTFQSLIYVKLFFLASVIWVL